VSRGIDTGTANAVDAAHIITFPLVEMALDSGGLYLCGAAHDVTYLGNTYTSVYGLGQIEPIEETDTSVMGLAFTLSGVPGSTIAIALGNEVQGRGCAVRMAFIDSGGVLRVDNNVWVGYLDQMTVEDGTPDATIRVTAEHRMVRWDTPRPVRFSHEDQLVLAPGDKFFEYAAALSEQVIVWPNKEFFKQ
jgi:hypothetical protein